MIATLILAAGRSARFGSDKLAADVAGRPLVEWTVDVVTRAVPPMTCRLVVGRDSRYRRGVGGVSALEVADADLGMSHSLVGGLKGLPREYMGAMVVLADTPLAACATGAVHSRAMRAPDAIVAVRRSDKTPHPVYLPRWTWPDVADGDHGLRELLDNDTVWVDGSEFPDPIDVDTPEDLAALGPQLDALRLPGNA